MGLQDILGKLGGQAGQQGGLDNIQSLFGGNGLQGIITQLTSAGMGQHVQSWVGSGENQKISGQQIQQAMDPAALQQMSRQTGMSTDQISDHVAQALPHLVDQVTPDGEIPARDPLQQGVSALRGMSSSR
jgi:uncharacterized protein YidB (DUF937 family)